MSFPVFLLLKNERRAENNGNQSADVRTDGRPCGGAAHFQLEMRGCGFLTQHPGFTKGVCKMQMPSIREKGRQTMKINENIISTINNCSDMSILNYL